jgi:hypothetical protein
MRTTGTRTDRSRVEPPLRVEPVETPLCQTEPMTSESTGRRRELAWIRVGIGAALFIAAFSQLPLHPEWAIPAFIAACLLEVAFVIMLTHTYGPGEP